MSEPASPIAGVSHRIPYTSNELPLVEQPGLSALEDRVRVYLRGYAQSFGAV